MTKRRNFLRSAATTAAAAGAVAASNLPAPAISQGRMEWRMVTSWPMNLPGPGVSANRVRSPAASSPARASRP